MEHEVLQDETAEWLYNRIMDERRTWLKGNSAPWAQHIVNQAGLKWHELDMQTRDWWREDAAKLLEAQGLAPV